MVDKFDLRTRAVWFPKAPEAEEYVCFEEKFMSCGDTFVLKIAAESDYVAYINGKTASFGIFAGDKKEKYFDELDVSAFCENGENTLRIVVRYEGLNSATHIEDGAFAVYELYKNGELLLYTNENTLCALAPEYVQHKCRGITPQLGNTSSMQARKEAEFCPCRVVETLAKFSPRPVKKLVCGEKIEGKRLAIDGWRVYDLSAEYAGYVYLKVKCAEPCEVNVAYGEHIADGHVRRKTWIRDFSLDFNCEAGETEFCQMFVRVAGRYLEVCAPESAEVCEIGVIPAYYPLAQKTREFEGGDGDIYKTAVRTLRLCMHTHYEDCPWREQALYVLDSRNQMLCGYYAFEETEFQRANLVFLAKSLRSDGLLELTYPAVNTPTIPFFSVMYPVVVYEYIEHTGDRTILSEVGDCIKSIMLAFRARIAENGLIANMPKPCWNFYEWTEGSDGSGDKNFKEQYDLILNCAYVYSANLTEKLFKEALGEEISLGAERVKAAIRAELWCEEKGLYFASTAQRECFTQLGNAFACLIGLGNESVLRAVKSGEELVSASLSMLCYVYDAILGADADGKEFVLNDIREKWGYMLSKGATSFWETMKGEADFGGAGSLCHGWSAMPVYYYSKLLG